MKISFVTDTYSPQLNGVATTLTSLVGGLRSLGHQVDVIIPSALSAPEETIRIPSVAFPRYPEVRIGLPAGAKLRSKWTNDRPDVIYVAIETPLGASAVSAARSLKIPVAAGFHTNFQHYMVHYQLKFLERATMPYLRWIHNRANLTFVPTLEMMVELEKRGIRNLVHLPRGVDTTLFSPSKRDHNVRSQWGADDSNQVGIYVGRMAPEKNLPLVVKTFREIRNRNPEFIGVFVGEGPKLEELKIRYPEFIYTGKQRGEELAKSFASADMFIFPSLTETFGNVTLEAMSSGLAVLAFDHAGARQYIKDGRNGYKAPFADESAFIAKAFELLADSQREVVRQAARDTALELRWDTVVEDFQNHLTTMMSNKGCVFRKDSCS